MRLINKLILLTMIMMLVIGCDSKNGDVITGIELPTDNALTLYSAEVGVYPDQTILDDPENPYEYANVNMENIWDLNDEAPSAKARFYLWGTILAKIPTGEHQYFTAKSLHELYTVGGSENAKEQAKKAYRALLDHFFNSVTWWQAEWLEEETHYAMPLKDIVGESLYNPNEMNLLPLYNDPAIALADLSQWGYHYDIETKTITKIN